MRIFGSEKLDSVLANTMKFERNESIQHPWITKAFREMQKS